MMMKIHWIKVSTSNIFEMQGLLLVNALQLPINSTEVKINTIAKGSLEFSWDTMFSAVRPSRVVIELLEQREVNEDYKCNPLIFKNVTCPRCTYALM